ncbi:MAG: D-alanyl-D-alanine carboxypeptidase/D-alanyl-D-alanine-endopeptidase [Paracoccaceae bacterium]
MTRSLSRRLFLGAALSSAAGAALAGAPAVSLRPVARGTDLAGLAVDSLAEIEARASLSGTACFALADVTTGEMLEQGRAGTPLPPASVAKAVTALYALEALGPGHRFVTRVLATAPVEAGVLNGDLILAGGGDPTLDTDGLAELAARLKGAGLREVRGRFVVWGGALPFASQIDPGQPDHVGYNPALSGLNLNFNRVYFGWRRDGGRYEVTMDARSARNRAEVQMARMALAERRSPVYTYDDQGGRDHWTVARGALGDSGARWLPVRKPELYAGEVFQAFARAEGIALEAPEALAHLPANTSVLAQRDSAPLHEILADMLEYSTNLTAEVVGLSATAARLGTVPAGLVDSAAEMSRWAGARLGMSGARFVDHSGLGDASRVSAAEMCKALLAAGRVETLRPILKDIPLTDGQGRPMRPQPVEIRAKTGTLHFVSALAGYVTAPDGRQLAFAIFTADVDRRATLTRAEKDRPRGSRAWNMRARNLQQGLLRRWSALYPA